MTAISERVVLSIFLDGVAIADCYVPSITPL
jgi:hypothetical protein